MSPAIRILGPRTSPDSTLCRIVLVLLGSEPKSHTDVTPQRVSISCMWASSFDAGTFAASCHPFSKCAWLFQNPATITLPLQSSLCAELGRSYLLWDWVATVAILPSSINKTAFSIAGVVGEGYTFPPTHAMVM